MSAHGYRTQFASALVLKRKRRIGFRRAADAAARMKERGLALPQLEKQALDTHETTPKNRILD